MLRIGLFSKLGKTTIKTLRHYDETGLLRPVFIDEASGYRYYDATQLTRLHEIVALRQMDFSIAEIESLLDGRHQEEILSEQMHRLREAHTAARDRLLRLEHYINSRKGGTSMAYQAVVKEIPSYTIFAYRKTLPQFSAITDMVHEVQEKLARTNPTLTCVQPDYNFNIYLDGEHREADINVEFCQAVTRRGVEAEGITFRDIPAITAVTVLHKGPYEQLGAAYAYAMQWIEQSGYAMDGLLRECYIEGIWSTEDQSQWLTEIQIPVRKR